jgi:hypothetical protein
MTPTIFVPARRSRILSAMFGSEARNALGMVPSASMANAQAATSRVEEIARRAFCAGFPVPRWYAVGAAGHVAEPHSSASRVVCRCSEWPYAISGVLNRLRA